MPDSTVPVSALIKQTNPRLLYDTDDVQELSKTKVEGQFIERKARKPADYIAQAISAFANVNKGDGGLIVMGIEDDGSIQGLNHLGQPGINSMLLFTDSVHARTEHKLVTVSNKNGEEDKVLLIYVYDSPDKVIELTNGKAYKRVGERTIEMKSFEILKLQNDKGQLPYELEMVAPYGQEQVDPDLINEYLELTKAQRGSVYNHRIEDILKNDFLIQSNTKGELHWTLAGYLIFSLNSKRLIPGSYIRFVRYSGTEEKSGASANIVKDAFFEGPLPVQIKKAKDFIKTQMKQFTRLGPEGKFVSEDEYPEDAWLEGIVNACVHRSYFLKNAGIMVKMFDNRLEISSPGGFPAMVTEANLTHYPRNPRIMRAFLTLNFVKMLAEGTRRIKDEMKKAGLPPPEFIDQNDTVKLILYNNIEERGKDPQKATASEKISNFFAVTVSDVETKQPALSDELNNISPMEVKASFVSAMKAKGWNVNKSETVAVSLKNQFQIPQIKESPVVGIYPGFKFRVDKIKGDFFIAIDYHIEVLNLLRLDGVLKYAPSIKQESMLRCFYREDNVWKDGLIVQIGNEVSKIKYGSREQGYFDKEIHNTEVLPKLPFWKINRIAKAVYPSINLDQIIKEKSLLTIPNAPRLRLQKTKQLVETLLKEVFPITFGKYQAYINPNGLVLRKPYFDFREDLAEPLVSFDHGRVKKTNILEGLTKSGSYDKPEEEVNVILLSTHDKRDQMQKLFELILKGSARYMGSEKTFGLKLKQVGPFTTERLEEYQREIENILPQLDMTAKNIFLVYTPESNQDDYAATYYVIKRLLLEKGFPCQMVDAGTLQNPIYKDLNLGLDLFAKVGYVPWVLEEGLPEADLFLGLSYSSISTPEGKQRLMGYVNVFDNYGRWCFYKGNIKTFDYENRIKYFSEIISSGLKEFTDRRNLRHVHIHYSQKFSNKDKIVLYHSIKNLVPQAVVYFVWINTTHPIRMYDTVATGDGSLRRGAYSISAKNQFYISTTGQNELNQAGMGTPKPLQINVFTSSPDVEIDHKIIAQHILSLTKLNWASSKSFCHEPITTKFAGDISYLVNVFLRQNKDFNLSDKLVNTPWFL